VDHRDARPADRRIRKHLDAIVAAVQLSLSNSRLEGINAKIRLIQRRGYGHHNPGGICSIAGSGPSHQASAASYAADSPPAGRGPAVSLRAKSRSSVRGSTAVTPSLWHPPQLPDRCRQGIQLRRCGNTMQWLSGHDSHRDGRRIGIKVGGQRPRHQIRRVPVDMLQRRPFTAVLASAPRPVALGQRHPGDRQLVRVHHPGSLARRRSTPSTESPPNPPQKPEE